VRHKQERNNDAGHQVAKNKLQETQIAGEGKGWRAHDRQGAGLGRNDGQADGPPGRRPPAKEVIFQAFLGSTESRSKPGDGDEIDQDDPEVEVTHADWEF